jgi:hypothetical protein
VDFWTLTEAFGMERYFYLVNYTGKVVLTDARGGTIAPNLDRMTLNVLESRQDLVLKQYESFGSHSARARLRFWPGNPNLILRLTVPFEAQEGEDEIAKGKALIRAGLNALGWLTPGWENSVRVSSRGRPVPCESPI